MTHPATAAVPAQRAQRCWTVVCPEGTVDVQLSARDDERVGIVVSELGRVLGCSASGLWSGSSRLPDEQTLAAPGLGHGAVLGLGRPVPPDSRRTGSSALELHVVGGPDAGRTLPLGQGELVLGRGSEVTVRLDDPDVSRQHAVVRLGGGTISVADLGSTNGTTVDGEPVATTPRPWVAGARLRIGSSTVTVTGPGAAPATVDGVAGGRLLLRPARGARPPAPELEVAFPRPPAPPPHRRLAWVSVALPAVGGVVMAVVLHTPTFLFFALLSPLVALGTWVSERWTGRRSGRRDAAAHAAALLAAERELAAAVREWARHAESEAPDLATVTTAARRRSRLVWSRTRGDADALTVRIGSGPGPTGVTRIEPDGPRVRQTAPHLPIVVDLAAGGGLAVLGPREPSLGVLAGVLAQLVTLLAPGDLELLLLLDAEAVRSWAWTRWLPHLDPGAVHVSAGGPEDDDALHAWLTATVRGRRAARGTAGRGDTPRSGWVVVVADRPLDPRVAAALRGAADAGVIVLTTAHTAEALPVAVDAVVRLGGETGAVAVLSRPAAPDRAEVTLDRLQPRLAAGLARDLAGLAPVSAASSLPTEVRLLDVVDAGLRPTAGDTMSGAWSTARDSLSATLGRTAEGPLRVDLCRQGPHALIAGTTGSGKSELLQTLITGLALAHPPDRCSFLLVDYKGGAAFAELTALPHTVGVLTDLDGTTTARALRSLTAELTRREALLAAHHVADVAALSDSVALARLVIVVDEFATLADELPDFVPGLVSIAQRGRSLGVHLVLATQRPAGVVSPEIRANCTLRICLRTTDEADSRDVLGTPAAAYLPVELPGRACLRSGSADPALLQVARVTNGEVDGAAAGPSVRPWTWPWATPPEATTSGHSAVRDSDLGRLTRAIARHTTALGVPAPHRPWQPPLPDVLPSEVLADLPAEPRIREPTRVRLGLVDLPDSQTQRPLELDLADGGAWLVVGGARSGRTTVLRRVLGEAVHRLTPDQVHVHVLESGGGSLAAEAARTPHAGTVIAGADPLRTVRLIDRLAQEVAERRAGARPGPSPLLLLLIDGMEAIGALLDDADPGRGSAQLHRLLSDGAAVGLTCVVTADRAVPGGRLAAVARERLVLPLPDRADYALAGLPPRAVPTHRPPGRALVGEDARECQIALPRPLPSPAAAPRPAGSALRIVELPPDPALALPARPLVAASPGGPLCLPLGPGGDEGEVLPVDLGRTGGLLVTGSPGSGRTTALDAFTRHLLAAGAAVLRLGPPPACPADAPVTGPDPVWLDPADEAGVGDWMAGVDGRPGVVIADDVGAPADAPALARLPHAGAAGRVPLIAAGAPGHLSGHYQGPIAALRRTRTGLLLCPGPGDADLLGIRLPRTPLPARPGSGWLVVGGGTRRVQIARHRRASEPEPARR